MAMSLWPHFLAHPVDDQSEEQLCQLHNILVKGISFERPKAPF